LVYDSFVKRQYSHRLASFTVQAPSNSPRVENKLYWDFGNFIQAPNNSKILVDLSFLSFKRVASNSRRDVLLNFQNKLSKGCRVRSSLQVLPEVLSLSILVDFVRLLLFFAFN
jgi:hypothetical protein